MNQNRLQPVRVLFIDHVPRMSGAEQSLADLVVGLRAGPVEPVVVLPNDGPLAAELRAHGVLVRMVPMSRRMLETSRETLGRNPFVALARLAAFLGAGVRLWRLIREVRPHVVHTNTLKSHLLAILPCRAARVPLVWHLRDILPNGWLLRALTVCSRFASVIIVPSRAVAEPFKGRRTVFRKLRLVPNGVRVDDFQHARADRSLREMMGVAASDPVVGIVGRIAPWKGQETFLRAAAMVAQRHPRAHFAVIGSVLFPENDSAFEQHLHRLVTQLGLEHRVTFLGWQPAPEAMASLDIFVHASAEPEPFGRAIVEAMAGGKPVIAAAAGAVVEIVPPAAGVLVPPGHPELLADAMDRLLADRKLRKRMGEAGAAVADSFFPIARTVQSVAQLYRHLAVHAMRRRARARRFPKLAALTAGRKRRPQARQPESWPQPPVPERAPIPRAPRPPSGHPLRATPRRVSIDHPEFPHSGRAPRKRSATARAAVLAAELARPEARVILDAQVASAAVTLPAYAPPEAVVPRPVLALLPGVLPAKPLYDAVKRALDLGLALAIVVVGLPLWITMAVLIKLESHGPVLFRGTVVGKDRRPFTYYKFRSMRINGNDRAHRRFIERYVRENGGHEHEGEIVYKLMGDDRVTTVGRWIRKFSLDEIPQIWNVIRGDMSFVGPRPPLDYEFEHYDEDAKQRLRVLPGITGMQQVWSRDQASFEKKLELDLRYIRTRSVWLDLKLIAHTILAVPRGH